ncbi:membrane protein [Streptomyces viridochromogenes]|uniref:Membrane protein n=1 Tax=Streptomyces viridochromogenes TaxID=1938 RepID=A0A0J7ZJM6_STRVR|nr:FUSC family protein [Streptomyces viridochromogenes]KMS75363.1 membrane protein [Streptomyces viridochromogenes]
MKLVKGISDRLPPAGVLRLGRPSDIWFKPALSVIVAVGPPNLALLTLGRLDLAMYTMAGSLCALYAHNRPYAARARTLAWVVLGMLGGLAIALAVASLTSDAVVLVTVGAVLAAIQKALCDATRIGPPGNVVLTFVSSAALFTPQTLDGIPGHLAPAAAAAAWAWLVGMAPGLLRPHGPERRATAGALNAAAAYVETNGTDGTGGSGSAVRAARQALRTAGRPSATRAALERLVDRAEVALAAPADADPALLRTWARQVRGNRPVPDVDDLTGLAGIGTEPASPPGPLWLRLGPLAPLAVRTALGCALAGYASLALGIGRPYWALVTAASLYQANLTLTWGRGVQRVVGNLLGVLLFAALVPLAHTGEVALVLCCLALNFGAEALIARNYWLGSVCVTPMALLVTEFAGFQEPGRLITERVVDTLVGALVGLAAAVAVPDRRWQRVVRAEQTAPRTLAATGRSRAPYPDQRTGSDTTEGVRP